MSLKCVLGDMYTDCVWAPTPAPISYHHCISQSFGLTRFGLSSTDLRILVNIFLASYLISKLAAEVLRKLNFKAIFNHQSESLKICLDCDMLLHFKPFQTVVCVSCHFENRTWFIPALFCLIITF